MAAITTHQIAHCLILLGYVAAMVLVPGALRALIRVHWWTEAAGAGFFFFCGVTHLGLMLNESNSVIVTVADHIQAASICIFIPALYSDIRGALYRVGVVLDEVSVPRMGRRFMGALQDQGDWANAGAEEWSKSSSRSPQR